MDLTSAPLLTFNYADITLIIVKTERQVIKVAEILKKKLNEELKRNGATPNFIDEQFYLLSAKIITTKQLIEDF